MATAFGLRLGKKGDRGDHREITIRRMELSRGSRNASQEVENTWDLKEKNKDSEFLCKCLILNVGSISQNSTMGRNWTKPNKTINPHQ